jgi:hypothetical protein
MTDQDKEVIYSVLILRQLLVRCLFDVEKFDNYYYNALQSINMERRVRFFILIDEINSIKNKILRDIETNNIDYAEYFDIIDAIDSINNMCN